MADTTLEQQLRALVHDVLDSQDGPHPVWADSPVAQRIADRRRRGGWPIRLLGVAALLAVGGGVLTLVGSRPPRTVDRSPSPMPSAPTVVRAPSIPFVLRGQFAVQIFVERAPNPYPVYFIDLEDPVLLHGPGRSHDPVEIRAEYGPAQEWAGRVVEFTPVGAGSATVVIQAPPPCGEGRYLVRYAEAPRHNDGWTLTFTEPQDGCGDRVELLVGGSDPTAGMPTPDWPSGAVPSSSTPAARAWTHQPTKLVSGQRYASWSFTEPFHFVMPREDVPAFVSTWLAPGHLGFGHPYWAGDLFDDWTLPIDHCDPNSGTLPDVPSSSEALVAWLQSNGRAIDRSADVQVDGRSATRYDTVDSASDPPRECVGVSPESIDSNTVRFRSRWYLIPTPGDTILFTFYGDTAAESQVADELVRSMTFDGR
jgi:hypothetical protein